MWAFRFVLNLLLWPPAMLTAGLCAAAAVAAQWGRTSLRMDVVAHFAPIWLIGAAAALAASMLFRGAMRWLLAGVALIGVTASGSLVLPEFIRSTGPHAHADAPGQIKIVEFNVWHDNRNIDDAIDWLNEERPDIAVIAEANGDFSEEIARRGGWSTTCLHCNVAILSRQPPIRSGPVRRQPGAPPAPITAATFEDAHGRTFEVIGIHNAWPTDADQPFQERRLAEVIAEKPRDRLIVTGDFNSAPWSFQRRRWDHAFELIRRDRAIPTWPARGYPGESKIALPFLPIDHVYAGPGWATVSVRRGPRLSSDHYPLVITLAPVAQR